MLKKFVFSGFYISGCVLLSRILGYVRDTLIFHWLGVGNFTDAYMLAVKFPSLFRKVISDGSMNNLVIPLLKERDEQCIKSTMVALRNYVITRVIFFTIGLFLLMPYIANTLFSGLNHETKVYFLQFSRFILPSIVFLSMSSIHMSFLNYKKIFFISAFSAVVCNFTCIVFLYLSKTFNLPVLFLGKSILLGYIVQFLFIYVFFLKFENKLVGDVNSFENDAIQECNNVTSNLDAEVSVLSKFKRRFMNVTLSSGVSQIMLVFSSWVMSMLPSGNISYFSLSDRVVQVPLSLIGIILNTIGLSVLTDHIKTKNLSQAKNLYKKIITISFMLSIVISVAIAFCSFKISHFLFLRGNMKLHDIVKIGQYLRIYILSIPSYTIAKVVSTIFFANGNTKVPLQGAIVQLFANLVFIPILLHMGGLGIASAFVISSWIYATFLLVYLHCNNVFDVANN